MHQKRSHHPAVPVKLEQRRRLEGRADGSTKLQTFGKRIHKARFGIDLFPPFLVCIEPGTQYHDDGREIYFILQIDTVEFLIDIEILALVVPFFQPEFVSRSQQMPIENHSRITDLEFVIVERVIRRTIRCPLPVIEIGAPYSQGRTVVRLPVVERIESPALLRPLLLRHLLIGVVGLDVETGVFGKVE